MSKFPKLPLVVKVLIAILLGVGLGYLAPAWAVRGTNTFTALFDQLLKFFIPLIIVGLVTPAIADVGQKAGKMLLITVGLAYAFTVCSGLFAYLLSVEIFPHILDFDATQQALMITLYIAMDSFGTACSVTGDGAIALIVDRLAKK